MRSIRTHFMLLSASIIVTVLVLAGFIFQALFSQNLERRVHEELKNYVNQLAADIQFTPEGQLIAPTGLSDLRFQQAYSGLYWQIDDTEAAQQLRSESLWDVALPLPDDFHDIATVHEYILPGPEGRDVIIQERVLVVAAPQGARMIRLAAAMDQSVITAARDQFSKDMLPYLFALGVLLLLGTMVQVKMGLKPLDDVTAALDDVKTRKTNRLEGAFPTEINRLTGAVNDLLGLQQDALERARKRSGDLAHSLKTPLTAIRTNAENLSAIGEAKIGHEIISLAGRMEATITHELLRSKLSPTPDVRKTDADAVQLIYEITRTLKRTPSADKITWNMAVPAQCIIAMDPHDLRELLGNIIENACKWAASNIVISGYYQSNTNVFSLTIEDDGPGIDASKILSMMDYGKRFDETTPGTGIGLSIVKEIAEIYTIPIAIQNRQSHGLSVRVDLPIANSDGK